MDEKSSIQAQRAKTVGKEILRAAVCYLCFIFLIGILSFFFTLSGEAFAKQQRIDMIYFRTAAVITIPFSLFSTVRAFELYDRSAQLAAAPDPREKRSFKEQLALTFSEPTLRRKLIVSLAVFISLLFVMPYGFGYKSLVGIFSPDFSLSTARAKTILLLTVAPLMIAMIPLAKTSAHRWWVIARPEERERLLGIKTPKIRLALEMLKITVIYCLGFLALPTAVGFVISAILIGAMLLSPEHWGTIITVILLVNAFVFGRIILKRRSFMKRLRISLKENGYTVTATRRPVASAIFGCKGSNIDFERAGKRYSVKIISLPKYRPSFISESGVVSTKRTVRFLHLDLFFLMRDRLYAFDSDASRIILFLPVPNKIYISFCDEGAMPDDGTAIFAKTKHNATAVPGAKYRGPGYVSDVDRGLLKPLQNGEVLGSYRFYSGSGLISAIDNDVLDKRK